MKIWKVFIGIGLSVFLLMVSSSTFAKSPEEMVRDLNESFFKYDWDQFGKKVGKYLSRDKRIEDTDFGKIGEQAANSVKGFVAFGSYVSHTIARKDVCGERLKRFVIIVFAEDAQYYITYWFSKPRDIWAMSKFSASGQGGTGKFFEKLERQLIMNC